MARNDAQPDRHKVHDSKAASWSFGNGISPSPDDQNRADAIHRTLANLIVRQIAADLEQTQPAPGSASPGPETSASADPTESRHAPAPPQGHGGLVSNSSPAEIQNMLARHVATRILVQNFDTLYVAIDVIWLDERFLTLLGDLGAKN
jgi:hypothetical protein